VSTQQIFDELDQRLATLESRGAGTDHDLLTHAPAPPFGAPKPEQNRTTAVVLPVEGT
jgi:hypothetical protein